MTQTNKNITHNHIKGINKEVDTHEGQEMFCVWKSRHAEAPQGYGGGVVRLNGLVHKVLRGVMGESLVSAIYGPVE